MDPDFARMDSQQPSLPLTGANSASGSAPHRLLAPERQPESFLSLSDSLSSASPHSTVSLYTTTDYSTSQGTLNLHTFSMPSPRPLHTSAQPPSEDTDESSYSPSLLSTSSAVRPWSFYQRDPFAVSDEGLIDSGAPDGGALFAEPSLVAEGERLKELFVPFEKEVQGSVVQSLRDSLYGGSAVAEVDDVWLAEDQTQPRGAEEDGEEEEEIDHDRMVPTDGHRLAAKVSYAPLPSTSRGGAFAMLAERLEQKAQGNQPVPCPQIELYSYETQWSRSYDPPPSTGTGDQDSLGSTTGETTLMGDEGKFGYVGDYQGTGRGHALPRWRIVTALSLAVVFMFWTLAATISFIISHNLFSSVVPIVIWVLTVFSVVELCLLIACLLAFGTSDGMKAAVWLTSFPMAICSIVPTINLFVPIATPGNLKLLPFVGQGFGWSPKGTVTSVGLAVILAILILGSGGTLVYLVMPPRSARGVVRHDGPDASG